MRLSSLLPEGEYRIIRCDIADKLITCGDGDSALLYLYALRHGGEVDEKTAMRALRFSKERFERAYFTLTQLTVQVSPTPVGTGSLDKPRYTAAELRQAREGDHKFAAVCLSAEDVLGGVLSESQVRSLFFIYDHLGLPAEVIIELLSYLKRDRGNVKRRDIEREAALWADMGIYTFQQAQEYLARAEAEKPLQQAVFQAMKLVGREPQPSERQFAQDCIEKGFSPDAIALGMRRTEQTIGHYSLNYLRKILDRWHEKGVHTVSEITALEPERRTAPLYSAPEGPPAAQTDTLEDWEKEWLAEVAQRRAANKED